MHRLFRDNNGAVTVFVTLMLIPSILISGTAVDMTRMYTARSIVEDSNLLASNAVLTEYNALLQDVYGLYGVDMDITEVDSMLQEYVKLSVYGEDAYEQPVNSFSLFQGSNLETAFQPIDGHHLANQDILKRQIEEYSKYRVPVVFTQEIMQRMGFKETLEADTEAVENKVKIDEQLSELISLYDEVYLDIKEIDDFKVEEEQLVDNINSTFGSINDEFVALKGYNDDYVKFEDELEELEDELDDLDSEEDEDKIEKIEDEIDEIEEKMKDLEDKFKISLDKIKSASSTLNSNVEFYKSAFNDYLKRMDNLEKNASKIKKVANDLPSNIDSLKTTLAGGKCTEEFANALTTRENGASVIDLYESFVIENLDVYIRNYVESNREYVADMVQYLEKLKYEDKNDSSNSLSLSQLKSLSLKIGKDSSKLSKYSEISTEVRIVSKFKEFSEFGNEYKEAYDKLEEVSSNFKQEDSIQNKAENLVDKTESAIEDLLKGNTRAFLIDPEGAEYYKSNIPIEEEGFSLGSLTDMLSKNPFEGAVELVNNPVSRLLQVGYASEMFSNYNTEEGDTTLSAIPLDTKMNYFYQSELEYIYNGNDSAIKNVENVRNKIFGIRFVTNYVSTFIIQDGLNKPINEVAALAGPASFVANGLIRAAVAMAESTIDIHILINQRGATPIIKTSGADFKFKLPSVADMKNIGVDNIDVENQIAPATGAEPSKERDPKGTDFAYIDYLRIFVLFKSEEEILGNMAKLIPLNITNYKEDINANEEAMSAVEVVTFDNYITDFEINTTVDMRMIFLSMPFAQKGVNGVVPSKTYPLSISAMRGINVEDIRKNENGYIVVEAVVSFVLYLFLIMSILSLINVVVLQARIHNAITQAATSLSMYAYVLEITGAASAMSGFDQSSDNTGEMIGEINNLIDSISRLDVEGAGDSGGYVISTSKDIVNNPIGAVIQLAETGADGAIDAAFEELVSPLVNRYLSSGGVKGDQYLQYAHVVGGIDGLDFSGSELIDDSGKLKIVVNYKIEYSFGGLKFPFTERYLEMNQVAVTKAWLNGNGDGYSE